EGRGWARRGTPQNPSRCGTTPAPGRPDGPRARARAQRPPVQGDARIHRGQSRGRNRMGARGSTGGGVRLSATAVLLVSPLRPLLHVAERAPGLLLNGSLPTPETTAMFLNASHPGATRRRRPRALARERSLTMSRWIALGAVIAALSACSSFDVGRYGVSVENVAALKGLGGPKVNVGQFTAKEPGKTKIACRAVGPITTPDERAFEGFIRKALIGELTVAGGPRRPAWRSRPGRLARPSRRSRMGADRDRLPPARRGSRGLRSARPRRARRRLTLHTDRPGAMGRGAALPRRRPAGGAGGVSRAEKGQPCLPRLGSPRCPHGGRRASAAQATVRSRPPRR